MPSRIRPEKESQIIKLHLQGASQTKIAQTVDVSQSTVSEVTSRFKKDVRETGLEAASASRGVSDVVGELRSLSADLRKAGVAVNEAKRGCRLKEELDKIGADFDMLDSLLAVYTKITPKEFPIQEFTEATVQMVRLEKEFGTTYKNILSEYKDKHTRLNTLKEEIKNKGGELTDITRRKTEAEADLKRRLDEKRTTLVRVDRSLETEKKLGEAGLSIEKGETVANMFKVFSDLIENKGLTPAKAAEELQKFLSNARSLEDAEVNLKNEVGQLEASSVSLKAEVQTLKSEKNKLALENKFLKEATESIIELKERHAIGVDEIVTIKSLAQKCRSPSTILRSLDTYQSLKEIEEQKAELEGAVEELTQRESSLRGKVRIIEEALAALPAKTDESIRAVESSLGEFSEQVQGLGEAIGKASTDVTKLMEKALDTGRDIAAIESQVEAYGLTSKLIDFVVHGKGEEAEVGLLVNAFLRHLSEWAQDQPKLSETRKQIESLREKIERQLILG
jgi:chromosome segregation ATPase